MPGVLRLAPGCLNPFLIRSALKPEIFLVTDGEDRSQSLLNQVCVKTTATA